MEEALDLSFDRLLMMMLMIFRKTSNIRNKQYYNTNYKLQLQNTNYNCKTNYKQYYNRFLSATRELTPKNFNFFRELVNVYRLAEAI